MADLVDAWRTFISNFSIWSKLGSQTLGLIVVLAISGRVILLTLDKRKLFLVKHDKKTSISEKDMPSADFILAAEARTLNYTRRLEPMQPDTIEERNLEVETNSTGDRALKSSYVRSAKNMSSPVLISTTDPSVLEFTRMLGAIRPYNPSEMTDPNARMKSTVVPGFDVGARSSDVPKSPSQEEFLFKECKRPPVLKKVRFSADVIEPAGDNREYRRRMKSLFYQRLVMERESCKNDNKRRNESATMDRIEVNTSKLHTQNRLQALASSRSPPDRMALYATGA